MKAPHISATVSENWAAAPRWRWLTVKFVEDDMALLGAGAMKANNGSY